MPSKKEDDLRKLRQENPDTIVSNTIQQTAAKKVAKLNDFERLTLAGNAVDEEVNIAEETGQLDRESANNVRHALHDPKMFKKVEKSNGPASQFVDGLKHFAPQIIGMAIGGLFEGTEGVVAGGDAAGKLVDGYRNSKRQAALDEQNARVKEHNMEMDHLKHDRLLNNDEVNAELKRRDQLLREQDIGQKKIQASKKQIKDQIIDSRNNKPIIFDPISGQAKDLNGEVIPQEFVQNLTVAKLQQADRRIDQADRRARNSETNTALRADSLVERKRKAAFNEEQKNELSDVQLREITDLNTGLDQINRIEELAAQVPEDLFGPIASRIETGKEAFDKANPAFTKLKQATEKNLSEYLNRISGTAVAEAEAARLAKQIPRATDQPKVFKAKLQEFRRSLKRAIEEKKKGAKKFQGKTIPGKSPSVQDKRARLEYLRNKAKGGQ